MDQINHIVGVQLFLLKVAMLTPHALAWNRWRRERQRAWHREIEDGINDARGPTNGGRHRCEWIGGVSGRLLSRPSIGGSEGALRRARSAVGQPKDFCPDFRQKGWPTAEDAIELVGCNRICNTLA